MKAKYINPYTDFGFKKLFGEEANKDVLMDFLNELLPEKHKIKDLTFKRNEQLPEIKTERKAIFDIFCESKDETKFIVEMQKAKIDFFKDRTVFYSTFPIREQAEKGEWNYQLSPVYCVAILDFTFDKSKENSDYLNNVQLKNQYCEVFYDKLTFIFIEMPLFIKKENELKTHFDKWLYFLKNLENFDNIPAILKEKVFEKAFDSAQIANFDQLQLDEYEQSLKNYRDLKGVIDTSFYEGKAEGKLEGRLEGRLEGKLEGELNKSIEIAKNLKLSGIDISVISKTTGLSKEEIEKL